MSLLERIDGPAALRGLDRAQLGQLAGEIRELLIRSVGSTGGHLGPNLGVVELTLALHRSFESPKDVILWDVGHQSYVHKIVTGRAAEFGRLRQRGGLSGYPSRAESEHDHIEHSHASVALSYAAGMAKADQLRGITDRHIVAVVGDGALTGGVAWEALNDIAGAPERPVIIVLNDNGRSYAPTVGALARHLARRTIADEVAPTTLFAELGLTYVGPVDGHDVDELERVLWRAKRSRGPVIVHCVTSKGRGYRPAEDDQVDHMHGVGVIDIRTGHPSGPSGPSWTSVFGAELRRVGEERPDVVAITAAMPESVGLSAFTEAFPERVFDVGIAEQHAVASAAGLAMRGVHPVVAVYSTFLHRAVDQVLMDVALQRLPVTFVVDRAGATGDDGPSHNGFWDLAFFTTVPGMRVAAPRDAATVRAELREALEVTCGPTAVRFPRGRVTREIPAIGAIGGMDVLRDRGRAPDVLVVAVGAMAETALDAAELLARQGVDARVVDPRWVLPVNPELVGMALDCALVVTVEDGLRVGGVGSALAQYLRDAGVPTPVQVFGVTEAFPAQAPRRSILVDQGLTAPALASDILEALSEAAPQHPADVSRGLRA